MTSLLSILSKPSNRSNGVEWLRDDAKRKIAGLAPRRLEPCMDPLTKVQSPIGLDLNPKSGHPGDENGLGQTAKPFEANLNLLI